MKKLFLFVSIALLFVACSDDEETSTVKQLPVSFLFDDDTKMDYEYDSSNRLTLKSFSDLEDNYSSDLFFTYEGSDLVNITEVDEYENVATAFEKKGNQIIATRRTYPKNGGSPLSTRTFTLTLNSNGLPVKWEDMEDDYFTYEYDSRNNISKIREYRENELYKTTTCTYDDKEGPFSQVNTPKWAYIYMEPEDDVIDDYSGTNNVITKSVEYSNPQKETWTVTFSNIYDANNYPTQITVTDDLEEDDTFITRITYRAI